MRTDGLICWANFAADKRPQQLYCRPILGQPIWSYRRCHFVQEGRHVNQIGSGSRPQQLFVRGGGLAKAV
jgi:hypothetical protein